MDEVKVAVLQWLMDMKRKFPHRSLGYVGRQITVALANNGSEEGYGSFDDADISLAIDYLADTNYLKTDRKEGKKYYRLGAKGQELLLGDSIFSSTAKGGVHISENNGVIITGGANYGNINIDNRREVIEELRALAKQAADDQTLSDEDRAELVQYVMTVQTQILSPVPDKNIIKRAMERVEQLAAVSGAIDLATKAVDAYNHIKAMWGH